MNILLIDDQEDILDVFKRGLVRAGYNVTTCLDKKSAIRAIEAATEIDVLVSDYNLDDGNGLELAVLCKEKFSNSRIIIMSGAYIDSEDDKEKQKATDATFVLKPFTKKDLVKLLKEE